MNNYFVYKHTSPDHKVYIGCTCLKKRFKYGSSYRPESLFGKAIKKYGWNNFTHEIIYSDLQKDEAFQKEIELIAYYKSNNPDFGYNRSIGGKKSALGYKHYEESKRKIAEAAIRSKTGKPLSPEHKKRLKENHADFHGVKSCLSKLTQTQVDEIRKYYKPHDKEYGATAYAKKFGVTWRTIMGVVLHETYKENY